MFKVHLNTMSTSTKTSTHQMFQHVPSTLGGRPTISTISTISTQGPQGFAMAGYPALQQLQQEVVEAAKLCSCEASLRQALQRLQAPAMLGATRGWDG